jgi:trk system potassium uptake protein TrkA
VGSAIANSMLAEGHEVSVLDEDAEAIALLDRGQRALGGARRQFTVGTALEIDALLEAGIEQADAFVASTDGDNTNLVIAQIAKRRFNVPTVVVRVLDPARAAGTPSRASRPSARPRPRSSCSRRRCGARSASREWRAAVYVVIVGAGKVGWNLARELINKRHEVT